MYEKILKCLHFQCLIWKTHFNKREYASQWELYNFPSLNVLKQFFLFVPIIQFFNASITENLKDLPVWKSGYFCLHSRFVALPLPVYRQRSYETLGTVKELAEGRPLYSLEELQPAGASPESLLAGTQPTSSFSLPASSDCMILLGLGEPQRSWMREGVVSWLTLFLCSHCLTVNSHPNSGQGDVIPLSI